MNKSMVSVEKEGVHDQVRMRLLLFDFQRLSHDHPDAASLWALLGPVDVLQEAQTAF